MTGTGSWLVAGLGNPIVLTVATERHVSLPAAQWTLIITLLGVLITPLSALFCPAHGSSSAQAPRNASATCSHARATEE